MIIGRSGCGKSVFLKHVIGILKPDHGEILVDDVNVSALSTKQLSHLRLRFGMLFQSAALFDSMTVGENVGFALIEHTGLSGRAIRERVEESLELVSLKGIQELKPSELSGGMKKRVGLARAIVMDPKIVFYDEPTAGLDPVMTGVVDKLTIDLTKKLQITSVVVTHDMNSVFRIADRIVMLHQGDIVQIGTPSEIKNSKNPLVQQFITGNAEGPISFMQKGDDYLEHLTAEIKE